MRVGELDYVLPPSLIAQHPQARRDESRLLVHDRMSGSVDHRRFADLPDVLAGAYLVVVNDTRVVPERIRLERPKGEVLLLERVDGDGVWEGLARPTRRLRAGQRYGPVELLEHLGLSLEDEHVRPPNRRHVQRLVARVQDEDLLHSERKSSEENVRRRPRCIAPAAPARYDDIARSTASSSSGESAIAARPWSSSFM